MLSLVNLRKISRDIPIVGTTAHLPFRVKVERGSPCLPTPETAIETMACGSQNQCQWKADKQLCSGFNLIDPKLWGKWIVRLKFDSGAQSKLPAICLSHI
jgi:hypothetical protein